MSTRIDPELLTEMTRDLVARRGVFSMDVFSPFEAWNHYGGRDRTSFYKMKVGLKGLPIRRVRFTGTMDHPLPTVCGSSPEVVLFVLGVAAELSPLAAYSLWLGRRP